MSLSWRWNVKGHTEILDSDLGQLLTFFAHECAESSLNFLICENVIVHNYYLWDCSILRIISYFKYLRFFVPRKTYWKDKVEKKLWDKIVKRKTRKEIIKYKYSNLNVYFIESFIAVLSFLFRSDNCFVQQCCESIFDLFD